MNDLPRHLRSAVFPSTALQLSRGSSHSNISLVTTKWPSTYLHQEIMGMSRDPHFPFFVNCRTLIRPPLHNVNKSKGLVASEGYQVLIIKILADRVTSEIALRGVRALERCADSRFARFAFVASAKSTDTNVTPPPAFMEGTGILFQETCPSFCIGCTGAVCNIGPTDN
jgi:hypothetical protein